ncbi:MAG: NAD(P)-binding protein, partial [Spirochaetaceae bacterium]|nr:NAD(P)-binding protein [Spirochaetaceae bacterium]
MKTIGVIGAGAWGTAIAHALSRNGNSVQIWAREEDVVHSINTRHENTRFLK